MKHFIKTMSYKWRIAFVIAIFALIPCLISGVIYLKSTRQNWKTTALAEYQNDVDTCALLMSDSISRLQSKMDYIRNSPSIRISVAKLNRFTLGQSLDFIYALDELIGSTITDSPDLNVRLYPHQSILSYGGQCFTLDHLFREFPLGREDPGFQEIIALEEGEYLWQIRDIPRGENGTQMSQLHLCLYTQMTNLSNANCVLEFSIPVSRIVKSETAFSVPESLFAVCLNQNDTSVNILLSTSDEFPEAPLTQYQAGSIPAGYDVLSSDISGKQGGEVVYLLPTSFVQRLIWPQTQGFIFIFVLLIASIVGISFLTSHLLTRRILDLVNTINKDLVSILNDGTTEEPASHDLDQIALRIRALIQTTRNYCAELEHYETELLRMELELVQMRFNPHFLYNTLGAIRYQIHNPEARKSIDSLCHYYRIILNNGYLFITVKEEIDMIREYLSIEKFVYQLSNTEFQFEIDEQISQCRIIKHLLQPVVENALKHGIYPAGRDYHGVLRISAFPDGDCICIRITDNGIGMTQESIDRLLVPPSPNAIGHGYGIYNVQQRIQVCYGKEYGLSFHSEMDKGTTVTVKIPITHESS